MEELPRSPGIMEDETATGWLAAAIRELGYISSMVLGLNDAH